MHLSERITRLEVKVNAVTWFAGASLVALFGIITILLTGAKIL
jgi:hypothetical protein